MRLPNNSERLVNLGSTGSGKSQAGVWHLSHRDFDTKPWIIIDHKRDELIRSIPNIIEVDLNYFPKKPGIYVYSPLADIDEEPLTELLWKIYYKGNIGLYIDEVMSINSRNAAIKNICIQGRTKKIPAIFCSQRPCDINRTIINQASFFQVFRLSDKADTDRLKEVIPFKFETYMLQSPNQKESDKLLKEYHSIYYDVKKNELAIMNPVPKEEEIIQLFEQRVPAKNSRKIVLL